LDHNAKSAAAELEFVPVRPPITVTKAITNSTDASKQAAAKGIEESGKYITRKFNDTSSLVSQLHANKV
jgi:hypothetical protein